MKFISAISIITYVSSSIHQMEMITPQCKDSCEFKPYEVESLPYSLNSLEPVVSLLTLSTHHGKHYTGYVNNINKMLKEPENKIYHGVSMEDLVAMVPEGPMYNNAAQAINHVIFFRSLSPVQTYIHSLLQVGLDQSFGSFDNFKKEFTDQSTKLFGSGWTWLVAPKGRGADGLKELKIISTNNAGSPFRHFPEYCALMVLDVWEHAYYLDYKNERVKFIDGFWGIVNWDFASERLTKALHEGNCNLD